MNKLISMATTKPIEIQHKNQGKYFNQTLFLCYHNWTLLTLFGVNWATKSSPNNFPSKYHIVHTGQLRICLGLDVEFEGILHTNEPKRVLTVISNATKIDSQLTTVLYA